jgi:hypothetical protein
MLLVAIEGSDGLGVDTSERAHSMHEADRSASRQQLVTQPYELRRRLYIVLPSVSQPYRSAEYDVSGGGSPRWVGFSSCRPNYSLVSMRQTTLFSLRVQYAITHSLLRCAGHLLLPRSLGASCG